MPVSVAVDGDILPEHSTALRADAEAALERASLTGAELSLLLCDDARMRTLNAQWRNIDTATDVLSFPQEDDTAIPGDGTGVCLGDIVISVDTAGRQADERGHDLRVEMRILLIHGLLHLLGYDHESGGEDLLEMASAETRLMEGLGWSGRGLVERCGS